MLSKGFYLLHLGLNKGFTLMALLVLNTLLSPFAFSANTDKMAILSGSETTNTIDPTDLNQTGPDSLKWSYSNIDSSHFQHSTSSFAHQVRVLVSGDYRLSFTLPYTLENTSSVRRAIAAEVYVNGVALSHGRANSGYIRQSSNHNQSSLHTMILLNGLSANDIVEIKVHQDTNQSGKITTPGAQLFLEHIDSSRTIFSAKASRSNNDVNLNSTQTLDWTETIKDTGFTHDDSSNPQNITLNAAGTYLVAANIPLERNGACNGSSDRTNVRMRLQLDGSTINGGTAAQAYIRCLDDHLRASLHWVGLVTTVSANQVLTFQTSQETSVNSDTRIPSSREASVFIEKINTANDVLSISGTTLLTGSSWNPTIGSEVQWNSQAITDSAVFTHSTSSNNHIITVEESGQYLLLYNDHMTSTSSRSNNRVRIKVNGSSKDTISCASHYIRNSSGHTESSCSLSHLLENLAANDTISVEHISEAATGTVNDASPALLTLIKVAEASAPPCSGSVAECTPDKVLHIDANDFTSILDESARNANDLSFSGSVATAKDVSGSAAIHDSVQTTASARPSFDTTHKFISFDGVDDHFDVANHADLNLASTLKQRTLVVAFRTGSDVTSPQVIYEEGGTIRGMNVYIRAGRIYIGFWNDREDGDGAQPFTSASTPVAANSHYYATLVLDYSNYTGPSGPDGQLRGHINGVEFSSLGTTTSLLYAHSGAIGIGSKQSSTHYDNGSSSGSGDFFGGDIFELIIYNHAIDNTEALDFYNYLHTKWPDPQPVTNLALSNNYTNVSTQTPTFSWTASISADVVRYDVALGTTPGADNTRAWASAGLVTSTQITGLTLSECTDYFASVKAVDGDSEESTAQSTGFLRYDGTTPTDPTGLTLSGSASNTTSKSLSWTPSTDSCSFSHYEAAIGTSAGTDNIVAWTNIGNTTTHQFTGISPNLNTSTDYYISLRAYDNAGNVSNVVSSSAWQLDTCVSSDVTAPTAPSSFTVSGSASSSTSPNHSWGASTDSCGFSHYELAIGTTSGSSNTVAWTDIGNVLNHKFFSISPGLSSNTNYYTSIRAKDLAGNTSSVVSSSAWQLSSPGDVSSGLILWLDSNDNNSVFTDAGCSIAASDSNGVQCWSDKSSSGNNATMSTSANRPVFRTHQFNTLPILRFDGSDDVLDLSSSITTARTIFVVNKSTSTNHQLILGGASTQHFYTNSNILLNGSVASSNLISGSWRVDRTPISTPTTFTQTGSYSLISAIATDNVTIDNISSDRKVSGRYFSGDVAEVIIYNRPLDAAEITSVEDYLYNKWFTATPPPATNLNFSTNYTTVSSQTPSFNWSHSSAPDLNHYEVALGTSAGSNDLSGWTDIGLVNSYQINGLSLAQCTPYFVSVRAVDNDNYTSSFTAESFAGFDGVAPTNPSSLVLSGTASPTLSKSLTWNTSTDTCSFSHYEVALGTTSGGNEIIDWTSVGTSTSHQFTSISPNLAFATNYFMSVRAVDSAGNVSSEISSAAWQLDSCVSSDVTAPTTPAWITPQNNAKLSSSATTVWAASTDACSFSHYELAIGTSSGGTNIENWRNIGNTGTYTFTNISPYLNYGTNYYTSVRAVDSAGNTSGVRTSAAWTLTSPGDVDTTNLELWLDINDSSSLFQTSSCTTSVSSNNTPVGCVKDKSGQDHHAVQSTSSNQPVYQTAGFNGSPALYFSGTSDKFLDFGLNSSIRTVFWVLKEDSSSPGNTAFLLGDPNGTTSHFHRAATSGAIFHSSSSSSLVRNGTLKLNKATIDGTSTNMPTSEAVLSLVTTGNVTASAFSRDRTNCCGSRTWGGSLAELIVFNRALSSNEVEDIEDYLALKWGISSTTTEWTGASSTDWNTASNWSNGVPSDAKDCVINDKANDPVIASGTASCRDLNIGSGHITFSNGGNATLALYGNLTNTGTITFNDGALSFNDTGISATHQTLNSSSAIERLRFSKTAGGTFTLQNSSLTIQDLNIASGSNFLFRVPTGMTLTLPNGMTQSGAVLDIDGGATVKVGHAQTISVTGGTFQVSGTNDAHPQNTSNKGLITIDGSGRWAFNASGGLVALTGFIIDYIDVNGLNLNGTANLVALDGGQFTHLLADFSTPVKAIQLNTAADPIESVASNIGFHWADANANYSGTPQTSDNYYLVYAPACGNSALIFDQWFGDFYPDMNIDMESKIHDSEDSGSNCQISIDISASPVNLLSFKATPFDQAVELLWETGAESSHLGFNVYRSENIYADYVQVNSEIIRNFNNSTTFRGKYRYVDNSLDNNKTYYYMIEDLSIDGRSEWHGPVYAIPSVALGAAPNSASEPETNEPPAAPPISTDHGGGYNIIAETHSSLRLEIEPQTITWANASWNSSYKEMFIPGYSKTTEPGHPELLQRTLLIEVDQAFDSLSAQQTLLNTSDVSASLSGQKITPAATWQTNSEGVLTASYSEDSSVYNTDVLSPNTFYQIEETTRTINGKHFIEIHIWPVQYNPVQNTALRLDKVTLEIGLNGNAWQSPVLPETYEVSPAGWVNNLRIKYQKEGFYQLSYDDLVAAHSDGPFQGVDTNTLRLYHHGQELPLEIDSADSQFNSGDTLRYYAPFEGSFEDRFDEVVLTTEDFTTNEYQLANHPDPLRIQATDIPAAQAPLLDSGVQRQTLSFEQNLLPIFDQPIGGRIDHFYWKRIFTTGGASPNSNSWHDFSAELPHLQTNSAEDVIITVHLRGRGVYAQNPTHSLGLYINNNSTLIDKKTFTGTEPITLSFAVSSQVFNDGNNDIRLESIADQVNTGDFDLMDINKVEIEYLAYKKAHNGVLKLENLAPDTLLNLGGFSSSGSISIYDLSNPYEAIKYNEFTENTISGERLISLNTHQGQEGLSGQSLILIEDTAFLAPDELSLSYGREEPLKSSSHEVDYLIVGTSPLLNAAHPLVQYRESQGFKVMTAHLDQIYAEFSHGRTSSQAIRDLIQYARNHWSTSPKYLLLLGDATYDPQNHLGENHPNAMPVALEGGLVTDFGSDNYYVETQDSHLPTLAVGRIPTDKTQEVVDYINKVIDYETGSRAPQGPQSRSSFLLAGPDTRNENYNTQIDHLAKALTSVDSNMTVEKVYRSELPDDATAKQKIIDEFEKGHLFVNYYGHGAENVWDSTAMFDTVTAKNLQNTPLPIVLALNCLNSYYYDADPTAKSLGEELLFNRNGGAIAFWGSTSQTAPVVQRNLSTTLMSEVGNKTKKAYQETRLGDLLLRTKVLQGEDEVNKDALQSWTLFGDPALLLPKTSFSGSSTSLSSESNNSGGSSGGGCLANAQSGHSQPAKSSTWIQILLEILFLITNLALILAMKFTFKGIHRAHSCIQPDRD